MTEHEPPQPAITPEEIRIISRFNGLELSAERAEILAPQAAKQFALMRALEAIPVSDAEPAGALRLDLNGGVK